MAPDTELEVDTEGGPWTLAIDDRAWGLLERHLFPGDGDEHGAVLLAGVCHRPSGLRLLVREVLLAEDRVDYVPGQHGYRALTTEFIARAARTARDEGWAYLAAHCHGGRDHVAFSPVDLASHRRGYPSLLQITGQPVGALVVAKGAIAGELWLPSGQIEVLDRATILGLNLTDLRPSRSRDSNSVAPEFDRQARLFGAIGQKRLSALRVGVVGLGGAGSMAAEQLARLGIGELILVDPDQVEPSNVPRIVGSQMEDATEPRRRWSWRRWRPALKVDVAKRAIHAAGLPVTVHTFSEVAMAPAPVAALVACDWIVLAADSQQARHLVNAICHAYLIPAIQVGVKVPVDSETGDVGNVFAVARRVMPHEGCLWCNGLIDPTELQLEAIGDEGRRARAYVGPDAPAPSVITLNGVAVSMAMTDLMLATTGMLNDDDGRSSSTGYVRYMARTRRLFVDEPRRDATCPYCGEQSSSLRARGDNAQLPVPLGPEAVAPSSRSRRRRRVWIPWRREGHDS